MKQLLTIRVTAIEAFRFWLYHQNDTNASYINEENVMSTIRGEERFNVKASYGTAGHSLIENPKKYRTKVEEQTFTTVTSERDIMPEHESVYAYRVGNFVFNEQQAQPLLNFCREHPLMTREIALSKRYTTRHFDLIITGTCDHLEGLAVRDTKFKFSSFDLVDFISSIQWRLYLDMVGLKTFYYDFFNVRGFETMSDCERAHISECESMMLRAYPDMETDINIVLNEFADFVVERKLTKYMVVDEAKQKRILRGDPSLKELIS